MPNFPGTRQKRPFCLWMLCFMPRNYSRIVGFSEVNRASSHNRFRILLLWRAIRKGQIGNSDGCGVCESCRLERNFGCGAGNHPNCLVLPIRSELIRLVRYTVCKVMFTLACSRYRSRLNGCIGESTIKRNSAVPPHRPSGSAKVSGFPRAMRLLSSCSHCFPRRELIRSFGYALKRDWFLKGKTA